MQFNLYCFDLKLFFKKTFYKELILDLNKEYIKTINTKQLT